MQKKPSILVVCRWGNIRSVAFAYLLKKEGFDALACGVMASSAPTLEMLANWAQVIFIVDSVYRSYIPANYHHKVIDAQIGEDIWKDANNPELKTIARRSYYANKAKLWELTHSL